MAPRKVNVLGNILRSGARPCASLASLVEPIGRLDRSLLWTAQLSNSHYVTVPLSTRTDSRLTRSALWPGRGTRGDASPNDSQRRLNLRRRQRNPKPISIARAHALSLSLPDHGCKEGPKTKPSFSLSRGAGMGCSGNHGRFSAQVALPQSPIL